SSCMTLTYYYTYSLSFFSTDPTTTEISTLSLHDARSDLAVSGDTSPYEGIQLVRGVLDHSSTLGPAWRAVELRVDLPASIARVEDRKSTRLNSSHRTISYAVFCLKKKNNKH